MLSKTVLLALAASPLVAAHGKVAVVTGDLGGNGTALGILGGVVPGPGPNSKTEVDTTVFGSTKIATDGLGKTTKNGKNTVSMVAATMAQSGSTLPQVSSTNGTISGTFHIVTTDGAGPISAIVDPTATGKFSAGTMLQTVTQVPGTKGNIKATRKRWQLWERATDYLHERGLINKRASNVNTDHAVQFSVPSGTTCDGTVDGLKNVCLVKIANPSNAGPFGGVIAIQIPSTTTKTKREVEFSA